MAFDFSNYKAKMQKALDHVGQDLASLRTGRATVQMLDPVVVEAYGSRMRINEVASVQAPDPTMILVSPWDKSLLAAIERAITISGLNLNPVVDGDTIRIQVASLTEEKRKEMVKLLYKKIEDGKVMLRNVRGDVRKEIEAQKGAEDISEDDIKRDLTNLDEILKQFTQKLDEVSAKKEKELMTI